MASRQRTRCGGIAAETHAPEVIKAVLDAELPAGIVVNVNFPDTEPE
jgi:5'-nucleotidase